MTPRGLAVVLAFAFVTYPSSSQQQPPAAPGTKVEPTEVQKLKLQVAQKDAIIAQQQSQSLHQQATLADQQAQKALLDLQKLAADVKTENKWGDDVAFEPNQLSFTRAPEKMGDKPKPMPDPTAPKATGKP